jgi:hypothetical protein
MAAKHAFGLAKIEFAPIAGDGDVGTVWQEVGETALGTCQLTSTDPQTTDFNIEESDSPIESTISTPAEINVALSTYNISPSQLEDLYGGTVTAGPPDVWEAPDQLPELEYSWKLTDKKGGIWVIPRGKVSSKLNVSFAKDKLGQLDINVKILQPTKTGVKRIKYTSY